MGLSRRHLGLALLSAGAILLWRPALGSLLAGGPAEAPPIPVAAQDQTPNRPEFTLVARDFRYSPTRIEVTQDDLVTLTIRSEDIAYSFAVDEYRIVRRVPAGGSTTFSFRADRSGTFRFYSNLTTEPGHGQMEGQLVVRAR